MAPTILSLEPRALTVVQFEEAVFTCNATARPRPTITWFRVAADGNQTNVAELDRTEVKPTEIGERELSSELTISNAQPSDAGSYTCQADNVVSSVDESAVLTVHGKWSIKILVCLGVFIFILYLCSCAYHHHPNGQLHPHCE